MGLAPVNAWPLAWVAMVPLWVLAYVAIDQQLRLRKSLMLAAIWGVGYHGTALWWITGIHPMTWTGVSWLGSIAIALFSWAFITLWGAAIGMTWLALLAAISHYLSGRAPSNHVQSLSPWLKVLIGTAIWCAVEWVWSKGPLYWTSLSYTQSPSNLWILQLGQLSGPITITASLVVANGLLSMCLLTWLRNSHGQGTRSIEAHDSKKQKQTHKVWIYPIALFALVHLVGLGLYGRSLPEDPQRSLSVGLIQGNIPTAEKLSATGIKASRKVYLDGYRTLADQGVDLVITPEGAIPQPWNAFLQDRNPFQRAVEQKGVPLVLGTFAHQDINDNQTPLTQSLLTLAPKEDLAPTEGIAGRYNKVKLVPLGEYMPLENILGEIVGQLSPFGSSMVPGSFDQRLETPLGPMAAGICYESAFTSLFRQQVSNGGEVIFTASNNDPYSSHQMMQHHAQDVMRAVETDRWAVRVTNTGISGLVTPKGQTLWRSEPNDYTTYIAEVYRRRSRTLYVRFGDWLTPFLLISSALMIGRRRLG